MTAILKAGARRVDVIDEGGLLICLTAEVDLDDLLLAAAHDLITERVYGVGLTCGPDGQYETTPDAPTGLRAHIKVGLYRKGPCPGDCRMHHWHLMSADERGPGVFLGVYLEPW